MISKISKFLGVVFALSVMIGNAGFSANIIKINNVKDFGMPFTRIVIEGGLMNPMFGLGGNVEFPNLFGFLSASASLYWGPYSLNGDTDSHSYNTTNVGGVNFYKTDFLNAGFAGLYYGCKLGFTFAKEKVMESQRVTVFSESIGYNLIKSYYFNVSVPTYYRHMVSAELTFEPIGNQAVTIIDQDSYYDDAETNYYVNSAAMGLLKVMYQWESQMKYNVKYNFQLSGNLLGAEQSGGGEMYMKLFIGPMATIDLKGIGGYCGAEMGLDYIFIRMEGGLVVFQDRPAYLPFKLNVGFFLPLFIDGASEVERGSKDTFEI